MLDASLIYTAATRPTDRLILVADPLCLGEAIKGGNSASRRDVDLGRKLAKLVEACIQQRAP